MLPERLQTSGVDKIDEDIETLRELEILVDGEHHDAYMLQIFLKESAGLYNDPSAGPFFYEIIQRKGDRASAPATSARCSRASSASSASAAWCRRARGARVPERLRQRARDRGRGGRAAGRPELAAAGAVRALRRAALGLGVHRAARPQPPHLGLPDPAERRPPAVRAGRAPDPALGPVRRGPADAEPAALEPAGAARGADHVRRGPVHARRQRLRPRPARAPRCTSTSRTGRWSTPRSRTPMASS